MPMSLTNANSIRVLITGAASGLGRACASSYLSSGASVFMLDRLEKHTFMDAMSDGFPKNGRRAYYQTDVTSEEEVQSALKAFVSEYGAGPNVLINCAGVCPGMKIVSVKGPHDYQVFKNTINVNLIGTFNMIRLSLPYMLQNEMTDGEKGVIINTASIAAYEGQMGQVAYAASKGGVVGMTLPIARDLADKHIRCMTIAPGLFETPLLAGLNESAKASLTVSIPFPHRLGFPEEFAELTKHIVANKYLNGEVIRLDAALRMTAK